MPLQTQILIRLALAVCSLIAGNVCLVFFTMRAKQVYPPPLIDRSAVLHIERDLAALAWSFVAASQYDPQGLPLKGQPRRAASPSAVPEPCGTGYGSAGIPSRTE